MKVLLGLLLSVPFLAVSCKTTDLQQDQSSALDLTDDEVFTQSEENLFNGDVHYLEIKLHRDTFSKLDRPSRDGGFGCTDGAPYGHIHELKFIKRGGQTITMRDAGMRIKGNTSCDKPQRGYRIKFNPGDDVFYDASGNKIGRVQKVFEQWDVKKINWSDEQQGQIKNQRLFGLKGMTLRRGADPTHIRDAIASDVFEFGGELARQKQRKLEAQLPPGAELPDSEQGAPKRGGAVYRGGMVWVKIHDGFDEILEGGQQHFGMVELVDDDLVELHYGKKAKKHLFKMRHPGGTFLKSDMPDNNPGKIVNDYEPQMIDGDEYVSGKDFQEMRRLCGLNQPIFVKKDGSLKEVLNPEKCQKLFGQRDEAVKILLKLRDRIHETLAIRDKDQRRQEISKFIDVDNILAYAASANLVGHWDSMIGTISNNDFVFQHKKTGKWGVITWDLDNTFGAGHEQYVWWGNAWDFGVDLKHRPLFKLVLEAFSAEYEDMLRQYLDGIYNPDRFRQIITRHRNAMLGDDESANSKNFDFNQIYKFFDMRYGNVWCHLNDPNKGGSKVKLRQDNGEADIYKQGDKWIANCERR